MGFEMLEDISLADVAFRVYERDLNEMFISGVRVLISVMIENPESIEQDIERNIEIESSELDLLLFEFLQEFIFYKDSESLFLLPDFVEISDTYDHYKLKCKAYGETINREKHILNVDVKAVTMHRLKVERIRDIWTATVVLDV